MASEDSWLANAKRAVYKIGGAAKRGGHLIRGCRFMQIRLAWRGMNSNENQKRAPQMSRDLDELSSGPEPVHALGSTQCRTTCLLAVALLFLAVMVQAEVFYENPVIPGDHPDPSIIRVGKDYWATSTSSEWGPPFPLLHSPDPGHWEFLGAGNLRVQGPFLRVLRRARARRTAERRGGHGGQALRAVSGPRPYRRPGGWFDRPGSSNEREWRSLPGLEARRQ